jgi:hypothetical protein
VIRKIEKEPYEVVSRKIFFHGLEDLGHVLELVTCKERPEPADPCAQDDECPVLTQCLLLHQDFVSRESLHIKVHENGGVDEGLVPAVVGVLLVESSVELAHPASVVWILLSAHFAVQHPPIAKKRLHISDLPGRRVSRVECQKGLGHHS